MSTIDHSKKTRRQGFTLIELLIVVAIIAILAAIAVPNFLEAQTRAKCTRVKADMRTMQTAMESYRVDNDDYVPDNFQGQVHDMDSFNKLSTPIAYISAVPLSPYTEPTQAGRSDIFEYWRGVDRPGGYGLDTGAKETGILYRITSVGPDNVSQYHGGYSNWPLDIHNNKPTFINGLYDGTNGTKSAGDLIVSPRGMHNN